MLLAARYSNFPIILSIGGSDRGIEFFLRLCILFWLVTVCVHSKAEKKMYQTLLLQGTRGKNCPALKVQFSR